MCTEPEVQLDEMRARRDAQHSFYLVQRLFGLKKGSVFYVSRKLQVYEFMFLITDGSRNKHQSRSVGNYFLYLWSLLLMYFLLKQLNREKMPLGRAVLYNLYTSTPEESIGIRFTEVWSQDGTENWVRVTGAAARSAAELAGVAIGVLRSVNSYEIRVVSDVQESVKYPTEPGHHTVEVVPFRRRIETKIITLESRQDLGLDYVGDEHGVRILRTLEGSPASLGGLDDSNDNGRILRINNKKIKTQKEFTAAVQEARQGSMAIILEVEGAVITPTDEEERPSRNPTPICVTVMKSVGSSVTVANVQKGNVSIKRNIGNGNYNSSYSGMPQGKLIAIDDENVLSAQQATQLLKYVDSDPTTDVCQLFIVPYRYGPDEEFTAQISPAQSLGADYICDEHGLRFTSFDPGHAAERANLLLFRNLKQINNYLISSEEDLKNAIQNARSEHRGVLNFVFEGKQSVDEQQPGGGQPRVNQYPSGDYFDVASETTNGDNNIALLSDDGVYWVRNFAKDQPQYLTLPPWNLAYPNENINLADVPPQSEGITLIICNLEDEEAVYNGQQVVLSRPGEDEPKPQKQQYLQVQQRAHRQSVRYKTPPTPLINSVSGRSSRPPSMRNSVRNSVRNPMNITISGVSNVSLSPPQPYIPPERTKPKPTTTHAMPFKAMFSSPTKPTTRNQNDVDWQKWITSQRTRSELSQSKEIKKPTRTVMPLFATTL